MWEVVTVKSEEASGEAGEQGRGLEAAVPGALSLLVDFDQVGLLPSVRSWGDGRGKGGGDRGPGRFLLLSSVARKPFLCSSGLGAPRAVLEVGLDRGGIRKGPSPCSEASLIYFRFTWILCRARGSCPRLLCFGVEYSDRARNQTWSVLNHRSRACWV